MVSGQRCTAQHSRTEPPTTKTAAAARSSTQQQQQQHTSNHTANDSIQRHTQNDEERNQHRTHRATHTITPTHSHTLDDTLTHTLTGARCGLAMRRVLLLCSQHQQHTHCSLTASANHISHQPAMTAVSTHPLTVSHPKHGPQQHLTYHHCPGHECSELR